MLIKSQALNWSHTTSQKDSFTLQNLNNSTNVRNLVTISYHPALGSACFIYICTPFLNLVYVNSRANWPQFWPHLNAKAPVLVNPTELEIFWPHLGAKALVLVNSTELEMFWPDFLGKTLVLVNPTELMNPTYFLVTLFLSRCFHAQNKILIDLTL